MCSKYAVATTYSLVSYSFQSRLKRNTSTHLLYHHTPLLYPTDSYGPPRQLLLRSSDTLQARNDKRKVSLCFSSQQYEIDAQCKRPRSFSASKRRDLFYFSFSTRDVVYIRRPLHLGITDSLRKQYWPGDQRDDNDIPKFHQRSFRGQERTTRTT